MEKWPQVSEMILGHTYYGPVPASPQALAFRDADILDFLGAIGIARILAVTEEPGRESAVLKPSIDLLRSFRAGFAAKLSFKASRALASPRLRELDDFFSALGAETWDESAL